MARPLAFLSWLAFLAAALGRPFFLGYSGEYWPNYLLTLATLLGWSFFLLAAASRRQWPWSREQGRSLLLLGVWLAGLGWSLLASPPTLASRRYFLAWVTDIVGFAGLWGLTRRWFSPRLFWEAMGATAMLLALYGLYQYFWGFDLARSAYEASGKQLPGMIPPELRGAFEARLYTDEPFATFLHGNAFGGYLILFLPWAAVGAWQALRARPRRAGEVAWRFLILTPIAWSLVLTHSKGAGLGLGAAVSLLLVRKPRRVLLLLALFLALTLFLPWAGSIATYDAIPSLSFRVGYWKGAWASLLERPWQGHGAGSFAGRYFTCKEPGADEAKNAHHSFLELAHDLGIPVALVLLVFLGGQWAVRYRPGIFPSPDRAPGDRAVRRWGPWLGGTFLVALLFVEQPFDFPPGLDLGGRSLAILGLAILWGWCWGRKGIRGQGAGGRGGEGASRPPRVEYLAQLTGLTAFLLQAMIDCHFYDHSLSAVFWMMLALVWPGGAGRVVSAGPGAGAETRRSLLLVGMAILPMLLVYLGFPLRLFLAEMQKLALEAQPPADLARLEEVCRSWSELSPLDPEPHLRLVTAYRGLWQREPGPGREIWLEAAERSWEEVCRVQPLQASFWHDRGQMWRTSWREIARAGTGGATGNRYLRHAERYLRRACELYPVHPRYRLDLAGTLDDLGEREAAVREGREALRLSAETGVPRLCFTPEEKAGALSRWGESGPPSP